MKLVSNVWMSLVISGSFMLGIAKGQYTCTFSDDLLIDKKGTTFLQHYVNRDEGTITMRIRYNGGQSWIGIGSSRDGSGKMAPGYAIIGDISRGVQRYNLASDDKSGAGVIPIEDANGHLKSSSFVQEGGESILEFTHDLTVTNPTDGSTFLEFSETSVWIWAVGLPDNVWEGKHKTHGAFSGLPLHEGCVKDVPVTTAPANPPNTASEATIPNSVEEVPASLPDLVTLPEIPKDIELVEDHENGSATEESIPAIQPELDESEDESDSEDESEDSIAGLSQGLAFFADDSEATRPLWVTHGITMGVAWGILAPLAITSAFLRNKFGFLQENARWLKIHFYLCVLTVVFTFIGFATAFAAIQKEGEEHFEENFHAIAGVVIFILVIVQAVAGYFRPSPVALPTPKEERVETNLEVASETSEVDDSMNNTLKEAFYIRKVWESTHRLLGLILLGLSWYNCHSGIILQAEEYDQDDEQLLLTVFWSITGSIGAATIFARYVLKF